MNPNRKPCPKGTAHLDLHVGVQNLQCNTPGRSLVIARHFWYLQQRLRLLCTQLQHLRCNSRQHEGSQATDDCMVAASLHRTCECASTGLDVETSMEFTNMNSYSMHGNACLRSLTCKHDSTCRHGDIGRHGIRCGLHLPHLS